MQAVIALPAVRYLLLMLFTWKVGFAASDSITHLKLQEYVLVPPASLRCMSSCLYGSGEKGPPR